MDKTATTRFNKLCLSTLVAVYVLILVGALVRSTGSGMGCPDWPRCFGKWVPPASVDELPSNYKESYTVFRLKKNKKFISMLKAIGMDETAAQLESDKAILIEEEFSPLKSKIEYINRVVGVVIGMMISLVLFRSFRFLKSRKKLFFAALLAWLSVVFTGWFGSIVVSTNLTPWTVSVHLGFAFLIVGLLVYLYHATSVQDFEILSAAPVWLARLCFALSVTQMIFGVQVREAMDQVAFAFADKREEWVANLGMEFIVHRSFSWIVLLLNGWLSFKLIRISGYTLLPTGLALMMFGSVATGVGMAYASVPAFLQPMHLLISVLSFGILLLILLRTRSSLLRLNHS